MKAMIELNHRTPVREIGQQLNVSHPTVENHTDVLDVFRSSFGFRAI